MGDNQKRAPASNFQSTVYDSDAQLRTTIIRTLLSEYGATNYYLANAMQSNFLQYLIHDSCATMPHSEYNRPKSDCNCYELNNELFKVDELNLKDVTSGKHNNMDNETLKEISTSDCDTYKYCNNNGISDTFRSEFETINSDIERECSDLLTGKTMHVGYEHIFEYTDHSSDVYDGNHETFKTKTTSAESTESKERLSQSSWERLNSAKTQIQSQRYSPFYRQWCKINKGKHRMEDVEGSCSFNDGNRSTIDKYNDDANNSLDRKELNCNKGKCKPSELEDAEDAADILSASNNDEFEMKASERRETKWQVFCDLYEELNNSTNKDNNSEYYSSNDSNIEYDDSIKVSPQSSLERKINVAINNLKVQGPNTDMGITKKMLKNKENLRLKLFNTNKSPPTDEETSTDTEDYLTRNKYYKNKRIYKTKKYLSNKFGRSGKRRKSKIKLRSSTSSEDNMSYNPENNVSTSMVNLDLYFQDEPDQQTTNKNVDSFEKPHKMNDKLIHEIIEENSDEESPYFSYFERYMNNYELNAEHSHQESGTITCDDYSKINQSFNSNETSCIPVNIPNKTINKTIANSGQSTSSMESIDLTKHSSTTIFIKRYNGTADSGLGTSRDFKPIENVFIVKNKDRVQKFDEISVIREELPCTDEWARICKSKMVVSKLPFPFSSSEKSKSSSENEKNRKNSKPKMKVIFKREATVIDLSNSISGDETSMITFDETSSLDLRNKFRCNCFKRMFCCWNK